MPLRLKHVSPGFELKNVKILGRVDHNVTVKARCVCSTSSLTTSLNRNLMICLLAGYKFDQSDVHLHIPEIRFQEKHVII